MAKVEIKLTRSPIGRSGSQKATLGALGLRRMNQVVVHNDSAGLRGQIDKVHHLVTWSVIEG